MIELIFKIKYIFYNNKYFEEVNSYNSLAGKLFCTKFIEFEKRAREKICAITDEKDKLEDKNVENLIEKFKKILKKDVSSGEKMDKIEQFFLEEYVN